MPTLEEIQKQIEKETEVRSLTTGEMELLPIILDEGEELKATVVAYYGKEERLGNLMATNRRLIHLTCYSPGNSRTESIFLDDIKSITERKTKGMSGGHRDLIIQETTGYEFTITRILSSSLVDIREYVKSKMNDSAEYKEIPINNNKKSK